LTTVLAKLGDHLTSTANGYVIHATASPAYAFHEGSVRPDVHPALTSRLIFGTVNSLIEWYRPSRDLTVGELADAVVKVTFDGLR